MTVRVEFRKSGKSRSGMSVLEASWLKTMAWRSKTLQTGYLR
jgi:hypothetical protein